MAYEIRQTVTPARNGPGQHTTTTTIDHNYNHWATTSRLAQGYYDRPQYTKPRGSSHQAAGSTTTAAKFGPGGVYTAKTYAPTGVYTTVASYEPLRSYTTSSAMAGVRSGPPYAPEKYTTTTSSYTTAAYNPAGGAARPSVASDRNFNNRPAAVPDRWPAHDIFRPTIGGSHAVNHAVNHGTSENGTSSGYLQGQIAPAEIVPGASGITADRATNETADVYTSELRPAVVYEKRIRKENEAIHDVVDRDRYTTEIRQVIQPVKHTVNLPEKEEFKNLAVVKRGAAYNSAPNQIERYERQRNLYSPGSLIPEGESTEKKTVYREPVIRERIRARIIEEIQPLIYREVIQPVRVESKQPIHETVIHGATVREIYHAGPITFEEFERRGYRLEGREKQVKINSHVLLH